MLLAIGWRGSAAATTPSLASSGVGAAIAVGAPPANAILLGGKGGLSVVASSENPETVRIAASAFADDLERVTGTRPPLVQSVPLEHGANLLVVGVIGHDSLLESLRAAHKIDVSQIEGKWEAATVQTVDAPFPNVRRAVVVAASDRRGAAYALFTLSRAMGVSPWYWWADVPSRQHSQVWLRAGTYVQGEPSVQYRGIFLNDEEFALLPWASRRMDPELKNFGPHFYARLFELVLRLHANSVWPPMHPGSEAFNASPINAQVAEQWGIVMGSSHSEVLLRNNVGEWNASKDGPWNYAKNAERMQTYWQARLRTNGSFENFYTVGLRGLHDSPVEGATTLPDKIGLVERALGDQQELLRANASSTGYKAPQVIWLYKEVLDLYKGGLLIPRDVTLGWVDDNYGYIRQLPTSAEQHRPGGSGMYYHVSYRGDPNDYLWLCSTPPSLIREEMTKAFDRGVRKYWVLNVGDLKPAESDTDYFLQLAWDEPTISKLSQTEFLKAWLGEQFPHLPAAELAGIFNGYYHLNFIRRPESMGFNGKNGPVHRTDFNPLAPIDENVERSSAWKKLDSAVNAMSRTVPAASRDAWYELVEYPVRAAAALNIKILAADRTYLDASRSESRQLSIDSAEANDAYSEIQQLTRTYNELGGGKWSGMMSAAPNAKAVFDKPVLATLPSTSVALPPSWRESTASPASASANGKFSEVNNTVSLAAVHAASRVTGSGQGSWVDVPELGVSEGSVFYRNGEADWPNQDLSIRTSDQAPSLTYKFTTITHAPARLELHILPTFPLDSEHAMRVAVSVDGRPRQIVDAGAGSAWHEATDPASGTWMGDVLRNSTVLTFELGVLSPGPHSLQVLPLDPDIVFEHLVIDLPGASPAYPVPPETKNRP